MYMTAVTALITLTQAEGTTTPPQEQQVREVKRGRTFPSERGEERGCPTAIIDTFFALSLTPWRCAALS